MTPYEMVHEFHEKFGLAVSEKPSVHLIDLRAKLIREEYMEVLEDLPYIEFKNDHYVNLTKELADLIYVVIGTAVTFGLPLEKVFEEVHRSNMSKLGDDGKPVLNEYGKVCKGPNYTQADVKQFF